ncbi:MAG: hypothetical protein PHP13_03680 [Methanomicrobium sp.]|nr:hypothetical protein [Methanomicrobium sp.]
MLRLEELKWDVVVTIERSDRHKERKEKQELFKTGHDARVMAATDAAARTNCQSTIRVLGNEIMYGLNCRRRRYESQGSHKVNRSRWLAACCCEGKPQAVQKS